MLSLRYQLLFRRIYIYVITYVHRETNECYKNFTLVNFNEKCIQDFILA